MKKKNVWKRVAAMIAAVVVTFTTGVTTYAATNGELRELGKEAINSGEYQTAKEAFDKVIASGEGQASDYWYAAKAASGMDHHYGAYEYLVQAMDANGADRSDNRTLLCQQMLAEMYANKDYRMVEQIYLNSESQYCVRNTTMRAYYGDTLYNNQCYYEAKQVYESLLADFADVPNTIAVLENMIGNCQLAMQQYEEAEASFQSAYALNSDVVSYCSKLLKMYFAMGETDVESMNIAEFAGLSNLQKADALRISEHYREALPYYQAAVEEGEDVGCNYIYSLDKAGEDMAAVEEANRVLSLDANNVDALVQLGVVYCDSLCEYELAVECFEKAYAIEPDNKYTLPNSLVALRKMGEEERLLEQARLVQEKFPLELNGYEAEINYTKDITVEEALEILGRYPDCPKDAELMGQLLLKSVNYYTMTTTTLESFLAYVDGMMSGSAGSNYYYVAAKVNLLHMLGRTEEALTLSEEAINMAGCLEKDARWSKVYVLRDAGRYAEAEGELVLLYRNCADMDARESQIQYYLQEGRYEEAYALAKEFASQGEKEDAIRLMAEGYYLQEDYEGLLGVVEEGLAIDPNNALLKAFKVVVMQELGVEGTEALLEEIDQLKYSNESMTRLEIDSLLGRYEDAMIVAQTYLNRYPGYMPILRKNYRYANLCHSKEYAELIGVEYVDVQKKDARSIFSVGGSEGGNEEGAMPWLPYAAGGVGSVALVGIGAALVVGKRK